MSDPTRPIIGVVSASAMPRRFVGPRSGEEPPRPFVTISRQPYAGGSSLAMRLVQRLNAMRRDQPAWQMFDRELIERVAAEHSLQPPKVASLEDCSQSWLKELLAGLSFQGDSAVSDMKVFRRIAQTIHDLASGGRVVLVGRGAAFITRSLRQGAHIRLVASADHRRAKLARACGLNDAQAAIELRRLEENRQAFFKRFFPNQSPSSELFDLTLSSDHLSEDEMVESVLPLVGRRRTRAAGVNHGPPHPETVVT